MRMPSAKAVTFIEVEYCAGSGEDGDPYRTAYAYFREDGQLVWTTDTTVPMGRIEVLRGPKPESVQGEKP